MAAVYYYSARSTDGAVVRGAVEAADEPGAIAMLRTRALFVTSLAREGSVAGVAAIRGRAGRDALVAFFRAFATMIGAGLPMNRALQAAIAQTRDQNLAEALRAVHDDISAGATLGDALARRPKDFTAFSVAMIRAGESAGLLDAALERLAESMEARRAFHKRLGAALVYPLFLTFAAILLVVFLMTSIVPMFASLYSQLHLRLPWETAGLLKIASVISGCKGVLAAGAIGAVAVAATLQLRHGTAIRAIVSERALGLPVVGNIFAQIRPRATGAQPGSPAAFGRRHAVGSRHRFRCCPTSGVSEESGRDAIGACRGRIVLRYRCAQQPLRCHVRPNDRPR